MQKDDLVEFINSLLENLPNFPTIRVFAANQVEGERIKALKEKLTFMKNLICFVTLRGVEGGQLGPLLTHTGVLAINAADFSFRYRISYNNNIQMLKEPKHMVVVPVESCVQALIASNLSKESYSESDEHIFIYLVDVLLCTLWEIVKSGTCFLISVKDQLQMLYEGLSFLRTNLKEKPKKFDEKLRHLIGLVVCDAGLVICFLSQKAKRDGLIKEMDIEYVDFLERIKLIKATVAEKRLETSSFFPRTNQLGFIDFLLENMVDLTSPEGGSNALVNHPVRPIHEELVSLRTFLGKIVELRNEDKVLQDLWNSVVEVAYRVEFLIDSLMVGDILDSSSMSFHSILEEIKIIKFKALNICNSNRLDGEVKEATKRMDHKPSQKNKPKINEVVVGFEDEANLIINRLTRGSRQVQIIPIVGMPGLGKTTIAHKIYHDPMVMSHFHLRAWCSISQVYHKKNLFLEILTCILPNIFFNKTEEELAEEIYKCLKRNRYLIVLDDIWDIEAWNELQASFPNDANGSRVIMTSRLHDVAPQDKLDKEPHCLRQLTHDESWDLLKEKLFPGKDLPPKLCELRTQIVEMCQGLPLTIVILAGILAHTDQYGWKEVVQRLSSSAISSSEQCKAALELSYTNLPENLRPCFLYFGAYPQDHEHITDRLTWLWVAEGFVQKTQFKSSEDVAYDYLMDLIGRSLVMVPKQRSIGGVKTCRIHDLLHDFCVRKAQEENFLQLVRGYDELSTCYVPPNLHRLCINCEPEHFWKLRLYSPTIRSLLVFACAEVHPRTWSFDLSFISCIFKLVKVLDLSQINLGYAFPREIEMLVLLRYLAVLGNMRNIPSSIASLSNLETFMVETLESPVLLPDTIWSLRKLRHLQIMNKFFRSGFRLPTGNLDNSSQLCNLDSFSIAILSSWGNMDKILGKFPNIRKLKLKISEYKASPWDKSNKVLVLHFLHRLESLNLNLDPLRDVQYQIEFCFSSTIKKLTLSGFRLPWCKISAIANLPNLEVLKLLHQAFEGQEWNMEVEEFPKVRFLKLASLDIAKWTASECENCFPHLGKLVLERCYFLKEVPSSLGNISTLETIEVSGCPNSASSVMQLQEEGLKYLFHPQN
ncbi:putative late blight resistance protein homolog R1A-3 [Coffea arabica]|uniref:Late blight resistance protein homolog R1A-3 n=1 Tax=Coffea arabica TaxID=13443 RepID=A0A6P6S9N5_COFAR|nr:putative late blight resistance protein homolog R1A-3 [Coffea arabica]